METSKEELQSTNEELETVNSELSSKVEELSRANNDLNNLLASTDIGTIFLDTDLKISRFTPVITRLFNLIQSDIGRPITDITSKTRYQDISKDSLHVLDTLMTIEKDIESLDNNWFQMRVMPYRTLDNVIDGVVITFFDITEIKKARVILEDSQKFLENKIQERIADLKQLNEKLKQEIAERKNSEAGLRRLATVVEDSNDTVTVQDLGGNILAWNRAAERMYGWSGAEAMKMNIRDIIPKDKHQEALDLVKKSDKEIPSFKTRRITKEGRLIDIWLVVTKLVDGSGRITSIATTERDISGFGEAFKSKEARPDRNKYKK
jgi:two-component system CheB/CheR fusion protein